VNVLEAVVKERIQYFVFASSSEVYGDALEVPIRETTPTQPRSVYAVTKLAGEEYARAYAKRYGFKYAIGRLFNCYGEGQVAEFVLPRFVRTCQSGEGPTVYGDGAQVRAFCNVEDTSRGVVMLLDALIAKPAEIHGEVFNIGNANRPISRKDLADLVIDIAKKRHPERKFAVHVVPFSESDREAGREIHLRIPDVSKARKVLGFTPNIGLEEGIDRLFSCTIPTSWFEPLSAARTAAGAPHTVKAARRAS
jgi:nucleoside-diphosphate-sugar epimerase